MHMFKDKMADYGRISLNFDHNEAIFFSMTGISLMKEDGIGNLFEYMYKLSIEYMTLLVFISFIFIDTYSSLKLLVLLARPVGEGSERRTVLQRQLQTLLHVVQCFTVLNLQGEKNMGVLLKYAE